MSGPGGFIQIFWGGCLVRGKEFPPNFQEGPPNFGGGGSSKFSGGPPNFQVMGGLGPPNFRGVSNFWNTVNIWPVRILLECTVVTK